jgi:hypothetical protein
VEDKREDGSVVVGLVARVDDGKVLTNAKVVVRLR